MMKAKLLTLSAAILASQLAGVSGSAQDLVPALVRAVEISTNDTGGLVYSGYGNKQIIAACAAENGITNLMSLRLVYDRAADALEVVRGTNTTPLCTPLTFTPGVYLSNTNDTRTERLSYVFWETNHVASGTLAGTQYTFTYWSNSPPVFFLSGQLQFALPASGTNRPAIYKGTLVASPYLFPEPFGGGFSQPLRAAD